MGNRFGFNQAGFNADDRFTADRTFSPDQPYILHLRNDAGDFLWKIEGYTAGTWRETINSAGQLNFTIPLDSDIVQSGELKYPNRVWIHDATVTVIRQFVITKTVADAKKGTFKVECKGLLHILNQVFSPKATTPEVLERFEDQVIDLLNKQTNANPVTLGFIHPSIGNLSVIGGFTGNVSIYTALMTFWKRYGGVISIDARGRLRWDTDNPVSSLYTMTLYEDIEKYEYSLDADSVINRIHPKGKIYFDGATHERRTVSAGRVDNTESQAIYDIRSKYIRFSSASTLSELTEAANRMLAYTAFPQATRNISAIDLARVQLDPDNPDTPHPEYIYPGSKLTINPPKNIPGDTTFSAMVLSVDRSLSDFLSVRFTIGSGDPQSWRRQGRAPGNEFFDLIASIRHDFDFSDEVLQEQDEVIWEFIDEIRTDGGNDISEIIGVVGDIQPVGEENDLGGVDTGVAATDHIHFGVQLVPFDSGATTVSTLLIDGALPLGMAFGYLGSAAGTLEGAWFFPPNGTAESDWIPSPGWN